MAPEDVLHHLAAEPFRPFRIRTASGRSFDIKHPDGVYVGKTRLTLSIPLCDDLADARGPRYEITLDRVVAIEPPDGPNSESRP